MFLYKFLNALFLLEISPTFLTTIPPQKIIRAHLKDIAASITNNRYFGLVVDIFNLGIVIFATI